MPVARPRRRFAGRVSARFLRARYKNFATARDFFDRLLRGGQDYLLLLDGLDEVVSTIERPVVRDEVTRLLGSQYPNNSYLYLGAYPQFFMI